MSVICPTVTAREPHEFREQMEKIAPFAVRVHIDLADGIFAPVKLVNPAQIWWPHGVFADVHCMLKRPEEQLETIVKLEPDQVILHAESEGDFSNFAEMLKKKGIKVGLALLASTPLETVEPVLLDIDHLLIFSGDLGHFGGHADLKLLEKVKTAKIINPNLEVGWDGGINIEAAEKLLAGGVDVLNVGGFIQKADNPAAAYAKLEAVVNQK